MFARFKMNIGSKWQNRAGQENNRAKSFLSAETTGQTLFAHKPNEARYFLVRKNNGPKTY